VPAGVQRVQQRLRDEIETNPLKFHASGLLDRIIHTRRHLAAVLGADPDGSALVPNTTAGVSVVLQSVPLGPGDEVLLTDHGYGAVALAVRWRCRRAGASVRTVALPLGASDAEVVSRVRAALRPGTTKLLIVDQLASATAQVLPVAGIATAAREHEIPVLVDAAHVPGMLPVQVDAIGADFWVGNLHKWAFAPRGTALLVVAADWRRRIDPVVVSWEQEAGFPLSVEFQGTVDYTPWLAAPAGLFTLRTLGFEAVRAHNAALAAYGQGVVGAALGLGPADLPDPGGPGSMRIIPLPAGLATTQVEAQALRQQIADKLATETAVNAWGGRGWLRLSAQVYNRADEYDRLAERLPLLLRKLQR
jgi:isopenicillin-N epimerase